MAARRLIIILLVLFAISVVAAMIAPERRGPLLGDRSSSNTESTASTTTTTEKTTSDELPSGEEVTVRIHASETKPESVKAFVGDQLALEVGSERSREIEIPAFGEIETAAPDAPADFNLLLRDAGKLPIIDADSGALLGRIDVSPTK